MSGILAAAADYLKTASAVAVLTGAGISKESGIPTFRDAQVGLWVQYDPQELATREGFLRDPAMVWDWYDFRRNKVWTVEPNPGHHALVDLEQYCNSQQKSFTLITQNIDNLHQRAGSQGVIELHGNIFRYKCLEQGHPVSLDLLGEAQQAERPPHCPRCNGYVRPDVVWFGETLQPVILQQAMTAALTCDVMLVVGTSGVVYPAAGLPEVAKDNQRAVVIEINPEESALTRTVVDHFLPGASGEMLPKLLEALLA